MTGDPAREAPRDERRDPAGEEQSAAGQLPGGEPELDVEAAFAAIVAAYGANTPSGVGPWPAVEDVDPEDDARRARAAAAPPRPEPPAPPVQGPPASLADVDEVDDDGFVPPEPPPLPSGDLVSRLAWAGVLGGPVFLLVAALVWRDLPAMLLLLALAAFVGGFVTLVARMPGSNPDDPDDGAVV